MHGWRSRRLYRLALLFLAVPAVCCWHARAELISAEGNVTLISGSIYYPVSCASDGNILSRWATDSPGGYQSDYFETGPVPVFVLDLGADVTISRVAFRGFGTNGPSNNSASRFSLRFATEAQGPDNMGGSILYGPVFYPANLDQSVQQDFDFSQLVTARYVEVSVGDNYFDPARPVFGGDRVGLSEIQFEKTSLNRASDPEPANGAKEVGTNLILRWKTAVVPDPAGEQPTIPNPDIIKHLVYLSHGGVEDREVFFVGEVGAGEPVSEWAQFGPVPLHDNTTYYWRIDEYISQTETLTGEIWSFTTKAEPAPCIETDLNDDCRVDAEDLLIFADQWLADMFSPADFVDRDGVNLTDFALLSSQWGNAGARLVINEFMASNDAFMLDADGMTSDWVEIYNPTSTAIDLDGWYLTDDVRDLEKWRFPDVSIGSEEYRVVFASGRNRAQTGSELHTNFVLDIKGEYLALVRPDGETVEHAWSMVPRQYEDISFGLATHPGRAKPEGCYFLTPTPRAANSAPYPNTGPKITDVSHYPARPLPGEDITVTATIAEVDGPVSSVTLTWRVMFGNDQSAAMRDDGLHGDGQAEDGVYGYIIPPGVAGAGQMLRYYIETADTPGNENRLPLPLDLTGVNQSPRYFGTVIGDPSVQSQLSVMEWFTTSESASHRRTGTRACVYYQGRFYDNIYVRQRGQATNAYSQKFNFNKASDFYVNDRLDNVGEINMNAKGADPAYIRQTLAFDTHKWCGTPSCESFLVLMQLNSEFDRVGVLIEQVDEDFLQRHGRDPDGALYKFVQRSGETEAQADPIHYPYLPHTPCFSDTDNGIEKKIRQWEDFSDLQAVVDGLMAPTELQRQRYVFDNFNLPEMMNYLAARAISNDCDDTRKNFYFYRDTNGTGEWEIYPWDNDFTFGIQGDGGPYRDHPFFGDEEHLKPSTRQWNVYFDVMFKLPRTRQMYLRRLRTMMDELLQPPGTPTGQLKYEAICDAMAGPLYPHISVSVSSVKSFFPNRRNELYVKYGPGGTEPLIPQAQDGGTEIVVTSTIISGNPGETPAYYYIPSDDSLGTQWTKTDFEHNWPSGYTGIGYERHPGDSINFTSLIKTDVNDMMAGRTSIYVRIPFQIDDPAAFDSLILRMKYDDGFVAYLNGNSIPPRKFSGEPHWDSSASGGRSDSECIVYEDIPLPASWLRQGTNVLAVHGLNYGASSSDLLILPELQGGVITTVGGGAVDQLSIAAVEYNPSSGNQDEEYIEITNSADTAIDISQWHLTGGGQFMFQPGTVIPSNSRIYVSPNVRAFRRRSISPRGGQGHFVVGNYKGHLSSWGETITLADSIYGTVATVTYTGNPSAQQEYLRISEIMYHPAGGGPYNEEEYEYVELKNIGSQPLLLDGVKFREGVIYQFPLGGGVYLQPGRYIVIVKNRQAFESRYDTRDMTFASGTYEGSLSNSGERINVEDETNSTILEFSYDDDWFGITDGPGFSLTIRDVDNPDLDSWDSKSGWRPSAEIDGSPGADDPDTVPELGSIVINEVLAHSHALDPDWIELHNTTADQAINIGGWFLSDSANDLKKYEIPEGTAIDAGGYAVFYENVHFGDPDAEGGHTPFALSENGETLYLTSGKDGVLTGYTDEEDFGASETNVSFGRYQKSTGTFNFVAMSEQSAGAVNAWPKVGPIVISEIMYHPAGDGNAEYVELLNIGESDETLFDTTVGKAWKFADVGAGGIEFAIYDTDLNRSVTIAPDERILLVRDKGAFAAEFPTAPAGTQIYAWSTGGLNNGGEKIQLSKPGDLDEFGEPYWIRIDRVVYSDGLHPVGADPWPTSADAGGKSLTRKIAADYGNDITNWQADDPSPGW